jgi:GTP-binding protein
VKVETAEFIRSAHGSGDYLRDGRPEVAFVGRSNVGKSTLLNGLLGRKALARTSSTPGRTQAVNYFLVNQRFYFVDLPGYGYAKVPQDLQAHWQAFLDGYFGSRGALGGLVVVMDMRHPLKDYDRHMIGYAMRRGLPAHALLTKADKLSRGAAMNTVQAVRKDLSATYGDSVSVQGFSGETKQGVDELRAVVAGWLEI